MRLSTSRIRRRSSRRDPKSITDRRIALTGTPVENRLSELWSIMEFCNPGYLGDVGLQKTVRQTNRTSSTADRPVSSEAGAAALRRLKTDRTVISDLPIGRDQEFATLANSKAEQVDGMLGKVDRSDGIQRRV